VDAGAYAAKASYPGDSNYNAASGDSLTTFTPGTLTQTAPTFDVESKAGGYTNQLAVTGATGPVTYATDVGNGGSSPLAVSASGVISAGTLPGGTYTVSGTDVDAVGDTGSWTFTLVVPAGCGQVIASSGVAPAVGTKVPFGSTISTGANGSATVQFPDNASLVMSANTSIVCDGSLTNSAGGETSSFSVLTGLFSYVSGLIGKKDPDQINIQYGSGGGGIRGCVVTGAVLPGGKLLVHVIQGTAFVQEPGKPDFDFPPGEGILFDGNSYQETLQLPPGAAALLPRADRPPAVTAVKATAKAKKKPVVRFKLNEAAQLTVHVTHGKRTVATFTARGHAGTNTLSLPRVLRSGSYTVAIDATKDALSSIVTSTLRVP
jgi:hypothetical protein